MLTEKEIKLLSKHKEQKIKSIQLFKLNKKKIFCKMSIDEKILFAEYQLLNLILEGE